MTTEIVGRLVRRGTVTLVLAAVVSGIALDPGFVQAAQLNCSGGTPSAAESSPPTPAPQATSAEPIPTEAAVAPEVNPPGDIPDNQAFVTYASAQGGYSVTMPEGWARTEDGANVVFADKLHRFTVEVACATTAATVDDVTTAEVPRLAQQVPAFKLVEIKAIELPAGPAVFVRYRTNAAPDEVTGKQIRLDVDRYELFKDGKRAAISLAGPAGSDNVDVSNQVSRSFRWTA